MNLKISNIYMLVVSIEGTQVPIDLFVHLFLFIFHQKYLRPQDSVH